MAALAGRARDAASRRAHDMSRTALEPASELLERGLAARREAARAAVRGRGRAHRGAVPCGRGALRAGRPPAGLRVLAGGRLGRPSRRGRVRASGDRRQARAAGLRAARRAGIARPTRSRCWRAPTTSCWRSAIRGRCARAERRARRGARARGADRGVLAARRGLGDRAADGRSVRPPGARRDALPRRLGALARVLRAPRAAQRAQRAPRARRRRVELPLPVPERERERSRRRAGRRARLGGHEGARDRGSCASRPCATAPGRWRRRRRRCGEVFERGGTLLALGNGGSATDAMDIVADLSRPLPGGGGAARRALDLSADPAIVTAIANDIGPQAVFARQVIAYGGVGDALIAFSTSGDSRSVIDALVEARRRGLVTIALVGYDGGRVAADGLADHLIVSRSQHIPRIQEAHATASHLLRELVELEWPVTARRLACGRACRASCRASASGRSSTGSRARSSSADSCSTTSAASCSRSTGGPAAVESFLARLARESPPLAVVERVDCVRARVDRRARLPHRRERLARRRRRARRGGRGDLRRLPRRAARSGRPPLPLPVHQLHELRPALHDRARRAVRPPGHDDGGVRDVRRLPERVRRSRATAASMRSRMRVRPAGRGARLLDAGGGTAK